MRLISALLLALVLALAPSSPAAAAVAGDLQRGIHQLTNAARKAADLEKLTKQKCVQRYAKKQARRMARQERMFHQDLGPVLDGCNLSSVGENVAAGFTSADAVVTAWLASPGHRANILGEGYRLLGVGAKKSDDGRWYLAQVFGRK